MRVRANRKNRKFTKRVSCLFFQSASGFLISVALPTIFKEPSALNPHLLIYKEGVMLVFSKCRWISYFCCFAFRAPSDD